MYPLMPYAQVEVEGHYLPIRGMKTHIPTKYIVTRMVSTVLARDKRVAMHPITQTHR